MLQGERHRDEPEGDGGREEPASDAHAVRAVAAGDDSALRRLYDQHGGAVFSLALSVLSSREEAEEVLVDVFLQAWRQAGAWDPSRGTPCAWLLVMARSRALDLLRRRRRYQAAVTRSAARDGGGLALPVGDVGPEPGGFERRERVANLLERLSPEQRDVIRLTYFGGLTQREIARALEIPLGTVKSRVRLAMEALGRAVAPESEAARTAS